MKYKDKRVLRAFFIFYVNLVDSDEAWTFWVRECHKSLLKIKERSSIRGFTQFYSRYLLSVCTTFFRFRQLARFISFPWQLQQMRCATFVICVLIILFLDVSHWLKSTNLWVDCKPCGSVVTQKSDTMKFETFLSS